MTTQTFTTRFGLGDRVIIDKDSSLVATVTALKWCSEYDCAVHCSWVHNGGVHNAWIEDWRLTTEEA